nr:hypothetical protein [Deltaproteobacteria bacterium]
MTEASSGSAPSTLGAESGAPWRKSSISPMALRRSARRSSSLRRRLSGEGASVRSSSQWMKYASSFGSISRTRASAASVSSPQGFAAAPLARHSCQTFPWVTKSFIRSASTPLVPPRSGVPPTTSITSLMKPCTSSSGTTSAGTTPSPLESSFA